MATTVVAAVPGCKQLMAIINLLHVYDWLTKSYPKSESALFDEPHI